MSEHPGQPDGGDIDADDPDRDPDNLNPRDDRENTEDRADPDADPENLNPPR